MTIRLGVVDQSPVRNGGTAEQAIAETLQLARTCEKLGYSRYWLAEHHSTNSFAGSSPAVMIAAVGNATERIRVGSGGVLLPHWSPYHVAESFRVLEGLFPGRIDLGVGRAPGGTSGPVRALRYGRGEIPIGEFPRQVEDLAGWLEETFEDDHPWRRVRATPRVSTTPDLWLLGSGGDSARVAAETGRPYAFAQFISGLDPAASVRRYAETFRPSGEQKGPEAIVALGVICAETREEAERLSLSNRLWRMRIIRGVDRGIPTPEQAEEEFAAAGIRLEELTRDPEIFAGDPDDCRAHVEETAARCGVEEVLIVTVTHGFEPRVRSYELLAEVLGIRG